MVWGPDWLSRFPVAVPSSRLLRLLRLRLLSMEVMLEEEVVRERARRVIPADGTEGREREREGQPLVFHSCHTETHCSVGTFRCPAAATKEVLDMQTSLKRKKTLLKDDCTSIRRLK